MPTTQPSLKEQLERMTVAETIYHNIEQRFKFWDRVRILFRGRMWINCEIKVKHDYQVGGSKTQVIIPPIFPGKKSKYKIQSNDTAK